MHVYLQNEKRADLLFLSRHRYILENRHIIGGGFPVGAICGKKEIMKFSDTNAHSKTVYWWWNVFGKSCNNVCWHCHVGNSQKKWMIYSKIGLLGREAGRKITKAFDGRVVVTGKDSILCLILHKNLEFTK